MSFHHSTFEKYKQINEYKTTLKNFLYETKKNTKKNCRMSRYAPKCLATIFEIFKCFTKIKHKRKQK